MQNKNDRKYAPPRRNVKKRFFDRLIETLRQIRIDPAVLVLSVFVLLQIFKLISLLITNKTAENIFIIPFQLVIFLVPLFFYGRYRAKNNIAEYAKRLRLRLPRVYQIPLMLSALLLMLSGNVLISLVFTGTDSLSDGFTLYNTFVSRNSGGFFSVLFLIISYAAVPAVCEELVFRAALCREYEKNNVVCGIIASSLFFALLHFDIYQLPVYLFSGIVLALSMYATGSSVVSMAVHMAFNVFGLFGQPYLNAFYTITGGTSGLFVFILVMVSILSAAMFCTFSSKCYRRRAKYNNIPDRKLLPTPEKLAHIISDMVLAPFAIASFVFYIIVIVIGIFL